MTVARGTHPNSLANLRPPWTPGDVPNTRGNPKPGPKLKPLMHKYLDWSWADLTALGDCQEKLDKLPMADVLVIGTILKAAKDQQWGDRMRELVFDRTDGPLQKPDVDVSVDVGVVVQLRWANGDEVEI